MPAVIERIAQPMVDLSLTYFFLCSLLILIKYLKGYENQFDRTNIVILIGLLLGITLSIKLTSIFLLISVFIGLIFHSLIGRKRNNNLISHLLIIGVICTIFLVPWVIRSYVYTNNPVYPFAYNIFGGNYIRDTITKIHIDRPVNTVLAKTPINSIMILWNITFKSSAFDSLLGISPFFIMILPLVFFYYRDIKYLKTFAILLLIGIISSILIFQADVATRYFFPILGIYSILIGYIIDIISKEKFLSGLFFLMLLFSIIFSLVIWYGIHFKDILYLTHDTKMEYYQKLKDFSPYIAMEWINNNTPDDSLIFLFRENRGYYLNRDYLSGSPVQAYVDYTSVNSSFYLYKKLKDVEVDFILINDGFEPSSYLIDNKTLELFDGITTNYSKLVFKQDTLSVYALI